MLDPKRLDELSRRLADAVPGAREMRSELERSFHALLAATFEKLDLVSREEFDVQAQVLARTRARLEELERQVALLERRLREDPGAADPGH
ncbi:MAG: accessory factor UbiK family protein [Gammaproteobacteria bacterium]|nr:accessory factor UbiK family protein [Gammaproteobacteria bacterium]